MVRCAKCDIELDDMTTGKKKIGGKPYCKECYYQEIGEFIEKTPIVSPLSFDIILKTINTDGPLGLVCKKCGMPMSIIEEKSNKDVCFLCYMGSKDA